MSELLLSSDPGGNAMSSPQSSIQKLARTTFHSTIQPRQPPVLCYMYAIATNTALREQGVARPNQCNISSELHISCQDLITGYGSEQALVWRSRGAISSATQQSSFQTYSCDDGSVSLPITESSDSTLPGLEFEQSSVFAPSAVLANRLGTRPASRSEANCQTFDNL
jgi:hypothetical protein